MFLTCKTTERCMGQVTEMLKLANFKKYVSEALWMLPPGAGDITLRAFTANQEKTCSFATHLEDIIREISACLSPSQNMNQHLLSKERMKLYYSGEACKFHGDGSGKRKAGAMQDDAEDTRGNEDNEDHNQLKTMLLTCAEKGLVKQELNEKTLGKCSDKFEDHGKAAVVNAYVLHHQLSSAVGDGVPLLANTGKPVAHFEDICRGTIPRNFQGVVLVATNHDKKKKKLRSLTIPEMLSAKGWPLKSFGLSLIGHPRAQFQTLSVLPPRWTVLSALLAACRV